MFWRNTGKSSYFSSTNDHSKIDLVSFVIGDKKVAVGGNIMSLIDKSCQSLTIPCDYCFPDLFHDCTSLESAPKLPATEIARSCYSTMFYGCSNLRHINVGFEKWGAEESMATYGWLLGVSPEGTFECPEGLEINYGVHSIPEGWTVKSR